MTGTLSVAVLPVFSDGPPRTRIVGSPCLCSVLDDDDATLGLGAFALTHHTIDRRDGIVDDLPFKRSHRVELLALTRIPDAFSYFPTEARQALATIRAPSSDVQHQAAPVTGCLLHREASQLLQCVEHLTLATYQLRQIVTAIDAHDRAIAIDIQVDVAVEVQDVEELLEVVTGDLSLFDESILLVILVIRIVDVIRGDVIRVLDADSSRLDGTVVCTCGLGAGIERRVLFRRLGVCVCCSLGCHFSCTSLCIHR